MQKTKGGWGCQCDRCFNKRRRCKDNGSHLRPVELNRGHHGHVWLCLACDTQLRGPSLPQDEKEILLELAKHLTESFDTLKQIKNPERDKPANAEKESNMKLEIAVLAGAESKQFLVDLTKQIDRLEAALKGAPAAKSAPAKNTAPVDADEEVETSEDDEDFAPKKAAKGKKAAAAFDDEEETEAEEAASDDDEGFMEAAPAKKAAPKAKKLTVDDINDACKARAAATGGKEGRAEVLALLKKHFKTTSVSEVKPEDYAKLIKVMAV